MYCAPILFDLRFSVIEYMMCRPALGFPAGTVISGDGRQALPEKLRIVLLQVIRWDS